MTQLQGQIRGPKIAQLNGVDSLTFSLLLAEGREVFVQCTPAVSVQAGQMATVAGTFDNEGTLVASLIQAYVAPTVIPVPLPPPKNRRWPRAIVCAILADLLAAVLVYGFLAWAKQPSGVRYPVPKNNLFLLFALFSFFFGDWLLRLFPGKQPAEKTWIAGLLAIILPVIIAAFNQ